MIVYGLVNRMHHILKPLEDSNPESMIQRILQEYKTNDRAILTQFELLIDFYHEDLLASESFAEFCDVIHLLDDIPNPDVFLSNAINKPPQTERD